MPKAVHKPAVIPAHWVEQVREEIERDIALRVLERVLHNTPVECCSRMHVVGKNSGDPRRVVDLWEVNKATKRQTHYVEPPFAQAAAIPANTLRFTSDAWNGYHSIPVDPRDWHILTFITPWGRLWYAGGSQGAHFTRDAFTCRYDKVIRELLRKRKCVDDVVGWADTLGQLFWDAVKFLSLTGSHGIVQNPKKFVFGREELEFVGFWIQKDGIRPTEDMKREITEYPRPTDVTGVRSWYGLVEQVAWGFAKTELMEPFCALLKKKTEFAWSEELELAFGKAKEEIVWLVARGVKSFRPGNWLCLVTDWSRTGIGYVLWQNRCRYQKVHPGCCKDRWVVTCVGSRFCTPTESKYHPIEGEFLGVVWALDKTSYYTLG